MRRPQLNSDDNSKDITPNQSLNNSLNQSDFNHTILRINDLDDFQLSDKYQFVEMSRNNLKEFEFKKNQNDSDDDTNSLNILIQNQNLSTNESKQISKNTSLGIAKDLNNIIFLLFLYFLQGKSLFKDTSEYK